MSKQIINYELFTNKKEELRAIQRRIRNRKRMRVIGALTIIVFVLAVFFIIHQSRCYYYTFKDEIKTEENSGVNYESFSDGVIKYSGNGIEYQKTFGVAKWNIALSFSKPFLAKTDQYILIGDQGGNQAILFNEQGKVCEYTMKYPIVQMSVADNGNILAILENDDYNYIMVYDKNGDKIVETRVTLDDTGYPVTAAISPDGSQMVVSYYVVENLAGKTSLAFYDLSKQISQENDALIGSFNYEGLLIPKIRFLSDSRLVAFGNGVTYYYDISDKPKELKKLTFDKDIESVFENDDYFGYVCDEDDTFSGKYHIYLYNKKVRKKMDTTVEMNFDQVFMVNNDIVATKDNECTIINQYGKILFQGELDGGKIENVLPCFGWRTYRVVFENKIVKMQLSFFNSSN